MVEDLEDEEVELAAHASYAFWYLEQQSDSCPPPALKKHAALKEARRHLVASNGDVSKALLRLQEACQYRKVVNNPWVCVVNVLPTESVSHMYPSRNVSIGAQS
jgi:hypothetical protein